MANIKSAEKRIDIIARNQERNKSNTSKMKTQIKKFKKAVEEGDKKTAETLLPTTFSVIDKSVSNGAIHKNAANRRKQVLSNELTKLK